MMKRAEAYDRAFEIVSKRAKYYPNGVDLKGKPVYVISYKDENFESKDTHELVKALAAYILLLAR